MKNETFLEMKMKNKIQLIFIIFVLLYGCASCGDPQINAPNEWVFKVQMNETGHGISHLEITCTGDQELQWITNVNQEYYTVKSNQTDSKFYSTLTIAEPLVDDTGYFNCSYKGNDAGRQDSTYVYVYDGVTGFASNSQHHHQTILVGIGDPIVLDCRTSHPDIKVTIFKNNLEIDKTKWSFNARKDVVLTGLDYVGKTIECKNDIDSDVKIFIIKSRPRKIPKPLIDMHRNSHYVIGDDFSLNCSIPIEKGSNPIVKWKLPKPNPSRVILMWKEYYFFKSILKIQNLTLSDSGNYTCLGIEGDYTVSDYRTIQVKERMDPFVKFYGNNDAKKHFLFVKEEEDFHWVVYFQGYPQNLKYTFYDPFKRDLKRNKKAETHYIYEDGTLSLTIKEVTAEDFGNYSVKLEAPNGKFDENYVILVVNATPKIEFGPISSLLQAGNETVITAFILAFSLNRTQFRPLVSCWYHQNCPQGIGSCDMENKTLLQSTLEKDIGPHNRFKSMVTLRPTSSGLIRCEVKNDLGINATQMHLNVSDKPASLMVTMKTKTMVKNLTLPSSSGSPVGTISVVEGDTLHVECFSLDFLYDNLRLDTNESFTCNSELSSGRCLNIRNIRMQDERFYECSHRNILTGSEEKILFRISVTEKEDRLPYLVRFLRKWF